ncbi:MAG: ABC transporter permease [Desulfomonile sp.]|nr:ABC transporter permease [Desulfomonile sp.]
MPWLRRLPVLLGLNLRYYRSHKLLSILCILGIALGVGIVVAVELINSSAFSSLSASVDFLSGRATHSVVSGFGRIDEKHFPAIWTHPQVEAAAPVIEVMATAVETGDEPIRFVGIDPLLDGEFRGFSTVREDSGDFVPFLTERPPRMLLSADVMKQHGLRVGDTLTVSAAGVEKKVRIHGTIPAGDGLGDHLAVLDIAAAQELFGRYGELDRIDLIVRGNVEELARTLPLGLGLTDRGERKATLQAMLYSFQLNLTAMSLLALFVGVFLIYNFSMFSVLSRREDMSLLITLGSDRRELVGAFLAESLALGIVGSILGISFGWLVGWLSIERVSSSISELYFHLRVQELHLTASIALRGLTVGLAATLVGTALPALEVAVTPPVLGMKRRTIEDRAHGLKWILLLSAAACFLGSLAAWWASRYSVFWGFASAFGVTAAFALATPSALSPFSHYLGAWLKRWMGSLEGFLAARTIRASLSRTSIAVAALAVALSMTIGVDGMIHSFRESVRRWLDGALLGDLYISPSTTRWAHPLPNELIEMVYRHPDVEAVERYSTHEALLKGKPVKMRVVDGKVLKHHSTFHFLAGGRDAWDNLVAGGIFVSESLRFRLGIDVGDKATLKTPEGDRAFPVVALTRDYSTDQGALHIDRAVYERIWNDRSVQSVALFLKPGASTADIHRSIVHAFPGLDRTVVSNTKMKEDIFVIFDKTFAPTATLKGVSLLVALLGVATALTAILIERSREMTVLGYLGVTRREMAKINVYQGLIMGAAAFLISCACGTILTYVIVHAINYRSFGWSIDVSLDPWVFLKTAVLTTLACLASCVYPTYRLSRGRPLHLEEE